MFPAHRHVVFEQLEGSIPFNVRVVKIFEGESKAIFIKRSLNKEEKMCNAYFNCRALSRSHAAIWFEKNDRFFIKDKGSSNGTFVNGKRLCCQRTESDPMEIFSGDTIQFGNEIFSPDGRIESLSVCCVVQVCSQDLTIINNDNNNKKHIISNLVDKVGGRKNNIDEIFINHLEMSNLKEYMTHIALLDETLKEKLKLLSDATLENKKLVEQAWSLTVREESMVARMEYLEKILEVYLTKFTPVEANIEIVNLHQKIYKMKDELSESVADLLKRVELNRQRAVNAEIKLAEAQILNDIQKIEISQLSTSKVVQETKVNLNTSLKENCLTDNKHGRYTNH